MTGFLHGIRGDARRLARGKSRAGTVVALLTNRGFHAMILYRLSHSLWRHRVPLLPMVIARLKQHLFAVDLDYRCELGPGIVIVHGFGLVVGAEVRIEGDCVLFHGVTLGDRGSEWVGSDRPDGHPVLETGIIVGAGAKILGPIRIGQNSAVGANAVVNRTFPPNSVIAGIPARRIGDRPEPLAERQALSVER